MTVISAQELPDRGRSQGEAYEIRYKTRQDQEEGCEGADQAFDQVRRLRPTGYGGAQMRPGVIPGLSQQNQAGHGGGEAKQKRAAEANRLRNDDKSGKLHRQPYQKSEHQSRRPAHLPSLRFREDL